MTLYFFDFDGSRDESEGVEFQDDAEACSQAYVALASMLKDLVHDHATTGARSARSSCEIRTVDGELIGRISGAVRMQACPRQRNLVKANGTTGMPAAGPDRPSAAT